jgi:alpha-tubulin suppressor-like RCC1 family protein
MSKRRRDVRLTRPTRREASVRPDPVLRRARLMLGIGMLLAGCRGGDFNGPLVPASTIVSDPVGTSSLLCPVASAEAYVSLPPDSIPTGIAAVIQNRRTTRLTATAVINGGFDPVPVTAVAGDTLDIAVQLSGGGDPQLLVQPVPLRHSPSLLRTDPSRGKRDVPLNTTIVMIFSEPVDAATLSASSVQLLHGASAVAGAVSLLEGSPTAVVFTPSAPLDANTDYRLVVTQAVRDLQGDALSDEVTVEFTTGTTTVQPATAVTVLPDTAAAAAGSQVQLTIAARDSAGAPVVGRPVAWSSDDAAVATVSCTGLVNAVATGVAHVLAEVDGRSGVGVIIVSPALAPVASVQVTPGSATVVIGGLVQLTTTVRDAAGNVLPFRAVAWKSSNSAVAVVSGGQKAGTAVVTGVAGGTATIIATSEGKSGTATITMGTVGPYTQVSAGNRHACAVTTDVSAWCWGDVSPFGAAGELGNGTRLGTSVPAAVAGGLRFSRVSAGGSSCALTPGGSAYCWGNNFLGALGSGGSTADPDAFQLTPVAVSGSRQYSTISVTGDRACALSTSGEAYCWGWNHFGELGVGTPTGPEICATYGEPCSTVPVAVLGGHTFTALTAGDYHTCALATAGAAYCWGRNDPGTLGDGGLLDRYSPVPVVGDLSFVALTAGGGHTCGLTSDGTAYCWGANDWGQLGIGTTIGPQSPCQSPIDSNRGVGNCSTVPVPVSGGQHFSAISAGGLQTCALTLAGAAYCWGWNGTGDGNLAPSSPTAVPGGLTFASLSANAGHACGVTWAGILYCWGANYAGQLGNGSTTDSGVPVKVSGQR